MGTLLMQAVAKLLPSCPRAAQVELSAGGRAQAEQAGTCR